MITMGTNCEKEGIDLIRISYFEIKNGSFENKLLNILRQKFLSDSPAK